MHEKHQRDSELSNELWTMKKNNYIPNIVWEIIPKHQIHNSNTTKCSLCLKEKLEIARYNGHTLLNKQSKLISKCRHQSKFALVLYYSKDWNKFSVTGFQQSCLRERSFPKFSCFKSSLSQRGFGNQWFTVLISLFSKHAYENTVFLRFVGSKLMWN